jgi:hypothetical protein
MRRKMCIYKCMLNVYKNQQNRQPGSRNLMGPKTLPTIWGTWQRSVMWSQASYRFPISWDAFLDPSDSYFLFAEFLYFYSHLTFILYMPIFSRIFLSNYWWQKSDIWSQASYMYPISWEAFCHPSDSYCLFAEEWWYHKWALTHSSSCNASLIGAIISYADFIVWKHVFFLLYLDNFLNIWIAV